MEQCDFLGLRSFDIPSNTIFTIMGGDAEHDALFGFSAAFVTYCTKHPEAIKEIEKLMHAAISQLRTMCSPEAQA